MFHHDLQIRDATPADVPEIARLGARFYAEAGWQDVAEWDDASIRATLDGMIANSDAIVLALCRGEVICGMAGGMVYPLYFNHAHRTGGELFYYVEEAERGKVGRALLKALEDRAAELGAKSWTQIALDKVRPEATGALYRRCGYRAAEHTYIKRLAA